MANRIQAHVTPILCVPRSQQFAGRGAQAIAAHPTLNNLLHIRAETLLYQALLHRTSFLGRLLNLEG
jgi:hypothetical protein